MGLKLDSAVERVMQELQAGIIEQLHLLEVSPADIQPDAPLFGAGLGLDSVDAIELIVLLETRYGIKLQDPRKAREILTSVRTMAEFVVARGAAPRA
jgi:acyl carrier protein